MLIRVFSGQSSDRFQLAYGILLLTLNTISLINCQRPNFAGLRPPNGLTQKDKYFLNSAEPALTPSVSTVTRVVRPLLNNNNQTSDAIPFAGEPQAVAQSVVTPLPRVNPFIPPLNPNEDSVSFSLLEPVTDRVPIEQSTENVNVASKDPSPPLHNRLLNTNNLLHFHGVASPVQGEFGAGHLPFYGFAVNPSYAPGSFPVSRPVSVSDFHQFPLLFRGSVSLSRSVFVTEPNVGLASGGRGSSFDSVPEFRSGHDSSEFAAESENGSGYASNIPKDNSPPTLPIDARGDFQLVRKLNQLPIEQRPFWLLNYRAIENQRNNSIFN